MNTYIILWCESFRISLETKIHASFRNSIPFFTQNTCEYPGTIFLSSCLEFHTIAFICAIISKFSRDIRQRCFDFTNNLRRNIKKPEQHLQTRLVLSQVPTYTHSSVKPEIRDKTPPRRKRIVVRPNNRHFSKLMEQGVWEGRTESNFGILSMYLYKIKKRAFACNSSSIIASRKDNGIILPSTIYHSI